MRSAWAVLCVAAIGCGDGGATMDETSISLASSPVGMVLASEDGGLLYFFDNDPLGSTVCNDTCSEDWPPYLTTGTAEEIALGAGITGKVSVFTRADGGTQVLINNYALFHFSGDKNPGDLRGQGILLDWFALTYAGQANMMMNPAPAWPGASSGKTLTLVTVDGKQVVADGVGKPLYAYAGDSATTVACIDDCVAVWPPTGAGASPTVSAELDAGKLGMVARPEGGMQVTYGGKPLYTYVGDWSPGELRGQGVGGKWYAVASDGTLVK
jgi:predicted lipoprotein with Yx(FWY)xxD motif